MFKRELAADVLLARISHHVWPLLVGCRKGGAEASPFRTPGGKCRLVLEEILKRPRPAAGTYALLAAMGPSFCSEHVLLRWK